MVSVSPLPYLPAFHTQFPARPARRGDQGRDADADRAVAARAQHALVPRKLGNPLVFRFSQFSLLPPDLPDGIDGLVGRHECRVAAALPKHETAFRAEGAVRAGLQGEPDQVFLFRDDPGDPFPCPRVQLRGIQRSRRTSTLVPRKGYHLRLAVFKEYSEAVKKREKTRNGM